MDNKAILYGVGGVLIGLLGGAAIGGATSAGKMQRALDRALTPAAQAQQAEAAGTQEALATLEARLATLETAVAEAKVDPEALAASVTAGTEGLAAKLDDMQGALGAQIADAAKAQGETVKAAMAEVSAGLAESARIAASAVVTSGEGAAALGDDATLSEPLGVGQTAVFADGALRVFVSRLDADAGSARVSVNGQTVSLGIGGTAPVTVADAECSVSVMAMTAEGVTLGTDCASSK